MDFNRGSIWGRKGRKSRKRHLRRRTKTAIGKYATINGNKSAVEKFSISLGFPVSEATVRNFKREVLQQLKEGKDMDKIAIQLKKKGR